MFVLGVSAGQVTARKKLNQYLMEAAEKIENLPPGMIACIFGLSAVVPFVHTYYGSPWILWKRLVLDSILFLTIPLLLLVFSDVIENIRDFAKYENRKSKYDFQNFTNDIQLHIWEERKYYEHVTSSHLLFISVGYNVIEDSTAENVEVREESKKKRAPGAAEDPGPEAARILRRSTRNRALSTSRKLS